MIPDRVSSDGVASAAARARDLLQAADRVVVLTGAGISAESGVPTFRGKGGLWRSYRPEDLATPEAFERDPRLVWEWYSWRRGLIAECEPNPGHRALARFLAAAGGARTLVTQNVDGLHTRAAQKVACSLHFDPAAASQDRQGGHSEELPIELHGAIDRDRCVGCGVKTPGGRYPDLATEDLPRCGGCGSLLRPDVVWFGESLDSNILEAAFQAAADADVCLVAGTSALVHPAASIPLQTLRSGGTLIEVNPDATPLSDHAAVRLAGPSGVLLPLVLDPQEDRADP